MVSLSNFNKTAVELTRFCRYSLSLFVVLTGVTFAADDSASAELLRVNVYYENDVLYLTDYGYTNGLKLALLYEVESEGRFWFKLPFIDDASKNHYMKFIK